MSLRTLLSVFLISDQLFAAVALDCESKDRKFSLSKDAYHGNEDINTPAKDFIIKYGSHQIDKGIVSEHQYSDDSFVLEAKDKNKVVFSLHAKNLKQHISRFGEEAFSVDKGFVVVKGKQVELDNMEFYCTVD